MIHLDYDIVSNLLSESQRYILKQPYAEINVPANITLDHQYQLENFTLPYQHLSHPATGTVLQRLPEGKMQLAGRLRVFTYTDFKSHPQAVLQLFNTVMDDHSQDYRGTLAENFLINRLEHDMPRSLMNRLSEKMPSEQGFLFRSGRHRIYGVVVIERGTYRIIDFIHSSEQGGCDVKSSTKLHKITDQILHVEAFTNGHQIQISHMLAVAEY